MNMKLRNVAKKYGSKAWKCAPAIATGALILAPVICMAEPAVTVPDVDTTMLTSAGTKIFVAVGLFVAVGMGLRMFKKA